MPGKTATVTIQITKKEGVIKDPTVAHRFNPPEDYIEQRKDSSQAQNGGEDSARAARRKQFAERMQREGGNGGGGFDAQSMQRRMQSRGFTRVWVMNERKKLEPIMVRTGISDGTFTEIVRGKLEEGQEIVIGTIARQTQAQSTSSPFNQQRQGGGGGGGVPRRL
jgi:HlyD family secretion protein